MRAKITIENYKKYKEYISNPDTVVTLKNEKENLFTGNYNMSLYKKINEKFCELFNLGFIHDKKYIVKQSELNDLEVLIPFVESKQRYWDIQAIGRFCLITFSGHEYFFLYDFLDIAEEPDYENMTITQMKESMSIGTNDMLPQTSSSLTVKKVKDELTDIDKKQQKLNSLKDELSWNNEKSLKKIEEEINALKNKLYKRKEELRAELDAKMHELNEKAAALKKDITILESEIYTIKCYTGETLEFAKIRTGKPSSIDTPLVINQKMMYLDEDLARIVSIYQKEISESFNSFEEALKGSDDTLESFCPQDRCVTFFRLSKNASYKYYDFDFNMYKNEELLHGKKIGCVIRDGENVYLGFMDESWGYDNGEIKPVTFTGNLFYKPGEMTTHIDDNSRLNSDDANSMASRVFAMSVLQGILDNQKIIAFPERINIMKPSQYIIYNYADAWICDDRFGDFNILTQNLRKYTREKDTILVIFSISGYGSRSIGENDRTYDCKINEGVYELNKIKDSYYYVRANRKYHDTCSNFYVKQEEIINISYMNSIWLKYYIQTKKLGDYEHDYAKVIKHFKRAVEVIKQRESEEMDIIKKYYAQADTIPEWQLKLSHWKLKNHIRKITDYQAKRVAKYFENGVFYEMANLFVKEKINPLSIDNVFSNTKLQLSKTTSHWGKTTTDVEFGYGKDNVSSGFLHSDSHSYASASFCINDRTSWSDSKKERAEKIAKMDEKLAELTASVPGRCIQDEKKLERIRVIVTEFLKENDITVEEIEKYDKENTIFRLPFIEKTDKLNHVKYNALSEDMVCRIKKGRCLLDDAGEYRINSPLWPLYYHNYLQDCYQDIVNTGKVILHERWIDKTKITKSSSQH